MSYIIPNGHSRRFVVKVQQFTTQHGHKGIQFVGEDVPDTYRDGFKYYDNNGKLLADYSKYEYPYRPNAYSVKKDQIEYPKPANDPVIAPQNNPLGAVYGQMAQMSQEIADLTPYTETKTAYIDETEIIFDCDRPGNILVSAVSNDGDSVEALASREDDKIIVSFIKPLEQVTNVTISIQR